MKTLNELVKEKMINNKLTAEQARFYVCQEIIISKISSSEYVDRVFLKGGVVMFNMTKNQRRSTRDIDFDIVRFDITSKTAIEKFIDCLNKYYPEYQIRLVKTKELHQEDYHGVRLALNLSDQITRLSITIDVGVHTLFAIEQIDSIFEFDSDKKKRIIVKVNPPEQIIAEKLYSLAKLGIATTRYRDLFDIYYLIVNSNPNTKIVDKCFELITINGHHGIKDRYEIIERVEKTLMNSEFKSDLLNSNARWLDVEYNVLINTILDFLHR